MPELPSIGRRRNIQHALGQPSEAKCSCHGDRGIVNGHKGNLSPEKSYTGASTEREMQKKKGTAVVAFG